jgi:hypothetical protein
LKPGIAVETAMVADPLLTPVQPNYESILDLTKFIYEHLPPEEQKALAYVHLIKQRVRELVYAKFRVDSYLFAEEIFDRVVIEAGLHHPDPRDE